jgi:hypothetical protein
MATTSSTTDRALPAATPVVLALLFAATIVLATGPASHRDAGPAAWLGGFVAAAFAGLVAGFRHVLPAAPGKLSGWVWLGAAACGCALIGRHALRAFVAAWPDFPASGGVLPALDLGDLSLLIALSLPALLLGLAGRLRRRRPALLLPASVGLVPLVSILLKPRSGPVAPEWPALLVALPPLSLSWALALIGPAALPLSGKRPLLHHYLPPLVGAFMIVGLPMWLLAGSKHSRALSPVLLEPIASRGWLPHPQHVAPALEVLLCLIGALALLVLASRVAARSLAWLRSGVFPVIAVAAGLLSAWCSTDQLTVLAASFGWVAVLLGTEPEGAGVPSVTASQPSMPRVPAV